MKDGRIVNDKEMLKIWTQHFESLATSGVSEGEELRNLAEKMQELTEQSKGNEEYILDVPFTAEEVERALSRLKRGKAAGPEGLMAEHLQEAGSEVQVWLRNVLNAIVELEEVPNTLKSGIIIPVYKGSGRDPVKTDSYRGVTLSSVLAKMLEMLVLGRMRDLLREAGIPHINQTAYQRRVSCADAIFATQEGIARYVREGSGVHMCLYDLEKAFDSIEYPVLFNRLFEVGVNGKTWRVLKSWYEGAVGQVRLDEALSGEFEVKRGVKQDSVLSPTLFLLIMNPLLQQLETSGLGLTINSFYAGGFAHADDIRTLATTVETLEAQVGLVRCCKLPAGECPEV